MAVAAASCSSFAASSQSPKKYDVFISFRGEDTRFNFTSHLHDALKRNKIETYIDDRLEKGEGVWPALVKAIEDSTLFLIVFSENYASSTWCLNELTKILECSKDQGQSVIPVFYRIDPSQVRKQTGSYQILFSERQHTISNQQVQKWKASLTHAANLSGWHCDAQRNEAELIRIIVNGVLAKLDSVYQMNYSNDFIGINQQIAHLESLLWNESQDVRFIGIWGMGGIGKTTIAKGLFMKVYFAFESFCFLNVREELGKCGITHLKSKLFSTLLEDEKSHAGIPYGESPYVMMRLNRKKVLVVLDDVNDSEQLKDLVGRLQQCGKGSRIIITSRDKQVLKRHVDHTYEVELLNFHDALQLFILNAFKHNSLDEEFKELSEKVVGYAKGVPLALIVLGSFLCGERKNEWKSQLEKLKKMPHMKIYDVLKLSYDSLDDEEKRVFLYIACFFKGYEQRRIIVLLDACGFSTTIGLKVLKDKALIGWESEMPFVSMHDLIQEMGREIVRQKSIEDPGERSHLCHPDDIYKVLKNDMGTKAIQSIILDMSKIGELFLNPQVFARMHELKFLNFFRPWRGLVHLPDGLGLVHLPDGLGSFPKELRVLRWDGYPLKSLPPSFSAERLIELRMSSSRMEKLWDGVQCLVNLKMIDLSDSECLLELPDFSEANNLQEVFLGRCTNLLLVHPSILSLPKLKDLWLPKCKNITNLRSDIPLKALQDLKLEHCTKLNDFLVTSANMRDLDLSHTAITEFPSSIGSLSNLEYLNLENCRCLMNLPLVDLRSLHYLFIGSCIQLRSLTDLPASLEEIHAEDCISLETVQFTPMAADPHNEIMKIINFQNCMKLDEQSLHVIERHAHHKLKNYAFKHLARDEEENSFLFGAEAIYPGSEVPDWFRYRTSQASITIDPHSELQGFIFCVTRHPLPEKCSMVHCHWLLEDNNGRTRIVPRPEYDSLVIDDPEPSGFGRLISDHVVLWYEDVDSDYINERIQERRARNQFGTYPKVTFEFFTDFGDLNGEERDGMKECGVYPVYASEGDKFIEKMKLGNKTKRCRDIDELEPSEIRVKSSKL